MAMQIDGNLILRLEQLAKLELDDEERKHLIQELNHILELVEQMNRLDTSAVEPLTYVNTHVNRFREDEISGQVERSAALRSAPDSDGSFFKVPKVIDL
ncbi:MAG TPA: Asp-tRNA(Asn)/Glu-tRNA(Gln) amidotransferase subunit GatC [Saprospiraceae bacterium]|jgi:aspartyl-tRNA(Asn)/glutamyl-tRNA(Gln) amidotransferase subunit C|nr:Asp-tRNA(Asn)/Glu-tRNA(Gln) amidotransferase subunit GatC [Saprospiraceae bacterium]